MPTLEQLASRHHALETVDISPFQRKARLLQCLWREQQRLKIGTQTTPRGGQRPIGSRLAMPEAQANLSSFLSDTIKDVVRAEVMDYDAGKGKDYKKPRIFNDLLSTQALSFNLFGEMQRNLTLATKVFQAIAGERVGEMTTIQFEYSPAGDRSALDVFVEYETPTGGEGLIGIGVKYHENLVGKPPAEQVGHGHLLVEETKLADGYDDGFFVWMYPEQNGHCQAAVAAYERGLKSGESFLVVTLEDFVRQIRPHTKEPWLDRVQDRYLNFRKVEAMLAKG